MPLILRRTRKQHPSLTDADDDYVVLDGAREVGRIYYAAHQRAWLWFIYAVTGGHQGDADTLDAAKRALARRWREIVDGKSASGDRSIPHPPQPQHGGDLIRCRGYVVGLARLGGPDQ